MARKYTVQWGWCLENSEDFETFGEALAEYRKHRDARVHNNETCDSDVDGEGGLVFLSGLTDEERKQL